MWVFILSNDNSVHLPCAADPLDTPPAQRMFHQNLGRMALTPRVKIALFILAGYFESWSRGLAGNCKRVRNELA
jgi:hypothetical protein